MSIPEITVSFPFCVWFINLCFNYQVKIKTFLVTLRVTLTDTCLRRIDSREPPEGTLLRQLRF